MHPIVYIAVHIDVWSCKAIVRQPPTLAQAGAHTHIHIVAGDTKKNKFYSWKGEDESII